MDPRTLSRYMEQMVEDGKVEVGKGKGKRFWRTPGGPPYPEGVYPGKLAEKMLNPISVGEIEETKDRTQVGDTIFIRLQGDSKSSFETRMERTTVKSKTKNLCIMQNGRSATWGQMAMYYRSPGNILTMEV